MQVTLTNSNPPKRFVLVHNSVANSAPNRLLFDDGEDQVIDLSKGPVRIDITPTPNGWSCKVVK